MTGQGARSSVPRKAAVNGLRRRPVLTKQKQPEVWK